MVVTDTACLKFSNAKGQTSSGNRDRITLDFEVSKCLLTGVTRIGKKASTVETRVELFVGDSVAETVTPAASELLSEVCDG